MKIVVLDGYTLVREDLQWTELSRFGEWHAWPRSSSETVLERIADADIIVTNKVPLKRAIIEQSPQLKFVTVAATGYNIVDTAVCRERGIPVSNVPTYGTTTVAQYTFALLLELCNHAGLHAHSVQNGEWSSAPDWTYWKSSQVELEGLTIGIVGFGRIGRQVARIAHAFGMKVIYSSQSENHDLPFNCERITVRELFTRADVVSLHSALSEQTSGLVNQDLLQVMKPTAFLINTARGQLINERDLADALYRGTIAGAALDVLATEPPDSNNPLISAPHCLITPHIAWSGFPARRRILEMTLRNIEAFLAGKPINVVN